MHTLEQVLEDVARQHGPLTKRGADHGQVWDAFNHYIAAVMEKRQTLSVLNFCKIGWRVEEQMQGKARLQPHFQVAESFARAHSVDVRAQLVVPDKHMTTIEEFNFSKAAIRHSQNLTKDNIFMGLRAIVHRLGEIVSSGQQMSVDFSVGKLVGSERSLRFEFMAELYLQEGLDVPAGALESSSYKPAVTFAPPSTDALSLSLRGSGQSGARSSAVRATALGGWEDSPPTARLGDRDAGGPGLGGAECEAAAHPASALSSTSAQERVQQEALDRHIAQMGQEAASAVAERRQWEGHLRRCAAEEQRDADWRKALHQEHSAHLQAQMQQAEERRAVGRRHQVEQASLHDFPSFAESPETIIYDYIRERRDNFRQDLDQQVDTKKLKSALERQREREIESSHVEAGRQELKLIKLEAAAKKESEKAALIQAWRRDRELRSARRAIRDHHKAPAHSPAADPASVVQAAAAAAGATRGPVALASLGALPSPRAESEGPPSSRLPTGSARRMPLGAAASLALHRERLGTALRR